MRTIIMCAMCLIVGLIAADTYRTHIRGREVILTPKLMNDIRTVLDCPKGMSALIKGKHIVMANCVK